MNPLRKNFIVGLMVLGGLVLLAVMIIKFGAAPMRLLVSDRIPVEFHTPRADGISAGSGITYRGVPVGTVEEVTFNTDQSEVIIRALLDPHHPPPENVEGSIRSQLVGGGASLSLNVADGQKPQGTVQRGQIIAVKYVGVDVLPPAFAELAVELRRTSEEIRSTHLIENLDQTLISLHKQIDNAGRFIDTLQKTVGDDKTQNDLRTAMDNLRGITEDVKKFSQRLDAMGDHLQDASISVKTTLDKTQSHIDDLAKQMGDRLEQVAKLLDSFQSITAKVDTGHGTAGLLINDPKLYQGLVDATRQLNEAIVQIKLYVQQVNQEGLYIKVSK